MPHMKRVSKESILTTRGEGAFEGLKVGLLYEGATVGLSEGLGVGLLVEGANVGLSEGLGVGCNGLVCRKYSSASKQS